MLTRPTLLPRLALRNCSALDSGFLPFLYCTRTILRSYNHDAGPRTRRVASKPSVRRLDGTASVGNLDSETRNDFLPLNAAPEPTKAAQHLHAGERSKKPFGEQGYTVNEAWETLWHPSPPKAKPPNHPPDPEADDGSFAPFAGWTEPSTQGMQSKPPKRLHRDTAYVPFQRGPNPGKRDQYADLEGTTITPIEKKAFEALFELHKPSGTDAATSVEDLAPSSSESIEQDEPDPTGDRTGHDEILNPGIHKVGDTEHGRATEGLRLQRPVPKLSEPLRKLWDASRASHSNIRIDGKLRLYRPVDQRSVNDIEVEKLERKAERDVFEVKRLMMFAKTDVDVWNILSSKVLEPVIALGLDGDPPSTQVKTEKTTKTAAAIEVEDKHGNVMPLTPPVRPSSASSEQLPEDDGATSIHSPLSVARGGTPNETMRSQTLQKLGRSFPEHLINAFSTLATSFPSSPLALTIIPLLQSLGAATATLGLSTKLYNLHIEHHWHHYRDVQAIDDLVREMDANVYEADDRTWNVGVKILQELRRAQRGDLGDVRLLMAKMERTRMGHMRLKRWLFVLRAKRQAEAVRKVREQEAREAERVVRSVFVRSDGEMGGIREAGNEADGVDELRELRNEL